MWQPAAAEDGPPVPGSQQAPQQVVPRPAGLCSSAARDPRMEPRMKTETALPPISTGGAASLGSGPPSVPFSEDVPMTKSSPRPYVLSLHFFLVVLTSSWPAGTRLLPSPTPRAGLPGSLGRRHPFEPHPRAAGLSQENRGSLGGDLLCSKAQNRCSVHMGYRDICGHPDICGSITLQQSCLFHQ